MNAEKPVQDKKKEQTEKNETGGKERAVAEDVKKDKAEKKEKPEKKKPEDIIAELKHELLRQRADFENARNRIERQKREELKYAALPIMRELLTVIDHLEMALKYAPKDDPLRQGVNMSLEELKKVLKNHSLEPIESLGKRFDPAVHEAVSILHDPNSDDNMVLDEQRMGYKLHDRVVRASQVIVNKHPHEETPAEKEEQLEEPEVE